MTRDLRLDSLKGFLILCVLWGHIPVVTASLTQSVTAWQSIVQTIDLILPVNYFHMLLFFALSILFVKAISWEFVKKRMLLLLVPYLVWFMVLHSIVFWALPASWPTAVALLKQALYGNWSHVQSILWFLPALFSINLYYALYRKFQTKLWWTALFFGLGLIVFIAAKAIAETYHQYIPFGIDLAVYLFPYLFVIDVIYRYREFFQKLSKWCLLLMVPIYAGSIILINLFEPIKTFTPFWQRIDLAQFTVPFTVVGFLAMTLLSATIFITFLMLKPSRLLAMVGMYSLPIYLLHLYIYIRIVALYNLFPALPNWIFILSILCVVPLTAIVAIVCSKLLNKLSPYARYVGMV